MPGLSPSRRAAALAALGLPEQAGMPEITRAYRRLARATHPDTTGRTDSEAGRRFATIHDAYQLLVDQPAQQPAEQPGKQGQQGQLRRPSAWRPEPPIVAGPVVITPWGGQDRSRTGRRR
jgi:curved DNA-binding protein CbpA